MSVNVFDYGRVIKHNQQKSVIIGLSKDQIVIGHAHITHVLEDVKGYACFYTLPCTFSGVDVLAKFIKKNLVNSSAWTIFNETGEIGRVNHHGLLQTISNEIVQANGISHKRKREDQEPCTECGCTCYFKRF